jgi:hypothetical protein
VAMAIGFAVSIPFYLAIGQWAFAVWGVAPVVANLLQRQWQRRWKAKAT